MVYVSGGNELIDPLKLLSRLRVTTGSVVADLGCGGAGHFVIPAAKLVGRKTNVFAVDILKSVLASVTSLGRLEGVSNIKAVWADLEIPGGTNIKPASLDCALLVNTLFLSTKHEAILQEAVRLVKSGGKISVVEWKDQGQNFGPTKTALVDPEKIKLMAKKLNLKLIDQFDAGKHHYGLTFQTS